MSTAVVTLKLTSEQFRTLRGEIELADETLATEESDLQDAGKIGQPEWQAVAQRRLAIRDLLSNVL